MSAGRIIFVVIALGIIFGLQSLVFFTFGKFLKKNNVRKSVVNLFTFIPFVLFNLPFIGVIVSGFDFTGVPKGIYNFYVLPFFAYQAAMLLIGVYLLVGKIIKLVINIPIFILKRFKSIREKIDELRKRKGMIKYDKSRRAFLTTGAALVSGYAFIGSGLGVIGKDRYEITYKDIKIKNLHEELNGTTLTLFSDIHSGPFMNEDMMREYCNVINGLNSDLIFIPGDLININPQEIHPFNRSFRDLKAKYGVYGTLGNHDYFRDAEYVARSVKNESPIKLLRNQTEFIKINGKEICVIGIEDIRDSGTGRNNILINYLNTALENTNEKHHNLPKILLSHKPYFFREISDRKIDLMLSGHTHGGQIVLAKFGDLNLSIAATVSDLISGYYKNGDSNLYVSRGIGTVGMPMRLNCPPEITQIKLVS